jgi:hypothetical protein
MCQEKKISLFSNLPWSHACLLWRTHMCLCCCLACAYFCYFICKFLHTVQKTLLLIQTDDSSINSVELMLDPDSDYHFWPWPVWQLCIDTEKMHKNSRVHHIIERTGGVDQQIQETGAHSGVCQWCAVQKYAVIEFLVAERVRSIHKRLQYLQNSNSQQKHCWVVASETGKAEVHSLPCSECPVTAVDPEML